MQSSIHFEGKRLRLAREFRSMTLAAVGEEIVASRQFVQQLETAVRQPNDDTVAALAEALEFPIDFFYSPLYAEVGERQCNFRSRRTTLKSVRNRVATHATLFIEVLDYLKRYVQLPKLNVPMAPAGSPVEIERLAERCRVGWGLGANRPIENITRAVETAGVVVTTFEGKSMKVDALSVRHPLPFIIRNTQKQSTSRARFDIAHEMGHLVMHGAEETGSSESESQADSFASALLLPRRAFLSEFPKATIDWPALFHLKERWGASVAAILRRAHDLNAINALQYRQANAHLRKRRWHRGEPREPRAEEPEVVSFAFAELEREFHLSPVAVAHHLNLAEEVLQEVTGISVEREETNPNAPPGIVSLEAFKRQL